MKKKVISLLLASALCLSMGMVAFADVSGGEEFFVSNIEINGNPTQVIAISEEEEIMTPQTMSSDAEKAVSKSFTFFIPATEEAFEKNESLIEGFPASVSSLEADMHKMYPNDFIAVYLMIEYEISGDEYDGDWVDDLMILVKAVSASAEVTSGSMGELSAEVVCDGAKPAPVDPWEGYIEQSTTINDMKWGYKYYTPSSWEPVVSPEYSNLFKGYADFHFWCQDDEYNIIICDERLEVNT